MRWRSVGITASLLSIAGLATAQEPAPGVPTPPPGTQTPGVPTTPGPNTAGNPAPADLNSPAGPARPGVGVPPAAAADDGTVVPPQNVISPLGNYGWGYSPGYAPYGWGGWTGTVGGDVARGLGALATGAGYYNEATARANAINADTVMRFNEYLYQAQQARNRRYYQRLAEERAERKETVDAIYTRLRDNPEARDIASGAALNVILDQLSAPGVYVGTNEGASESIANEVVQAIPFQYAAEAITISLADFLDNDPPAVLNSPQMKTARQTLRAAVNDVSQEIEAQGQATPESLQRVRNAVDDLWAQFDQLVPEGSPERRDGENYLKGVYGLSRMLQSPELDAHLGTLEKGGTTNVGSLLSFMNAFNLRFGAAEKPESVDAYNILYPKLVATRNAALPDVANQPLVEAPARRSGTQPASDFFSGLERSSQAPVPEENRPGGQPMRQPLSPGQQDPNAPTPNPPSETPAAQPR